VRCAHLWVLRPPSQSSTLLFRLQLWKTRERGTKMPKVTMMTRLKKNPSGDATFPSLFLVLDAKGGDVLYLAIFFHIPWVVI
jgi:hypothetical protein